MTDSDFASITHDGKLCDAKGQLGPREFEDVMRRQVAIVCVCVCVCACVCVCVCEREREMPPQQQQRWWRQIWRRRQI